MQKSNPNINLLDFWKGQIQEFKWKNALVHTSPYSELDWIIEKIESFFPKSDFAYNKIKGFRNNFITIHLLSGDPISIYFLAEYASYINYILGNPDIELSKLALSSKINYSEIRNRFFELFINRNLEVNGFSPTLTGSYEKDGNLKPLDSQFRFNNTSYLIECLKVSDLKKELISDLVFEATRYQKKYSQPFYHEELMGGFLQFKKTKITPKAKQSAIESFRKSIQNYFQAFRNNSSDELKAHIRFSDENVHIELMPLIIFNDRKSEIQESINDGVVFSHSLTGEVQGILRLDYKIKLSYSGLEELIRSKIHKKKRQHKATSLDKKIIAIEIEKSNSPSHLLNSVPVDSKLFESRKITGLIDDRTAILVVLRSSTQAELKFDIGLLCNNHFDPELRHKLTKLQIKWR